MLTAADVMTTDVISVGPDMPVRDIAELLYTRRISAVPVLDADGRLLGIVSEGDLIRHAAILGERRRSWWLSLFADEGVSARDYVKTHGRTAREIMTTDVVTVRETATLVEIAELLDRHRIKRVPVMQGDRLVGIVTRGDLLKGVATLAPEQGTRLDDQAIREQLSDHLREQPWAHLLDINVEDGVVHLHGTVESDDERRALRVAAENIPGVERVEDHLTLWTSAPAKYSGEG